MATASVTNTFVASTPAEAAEVNTNFTNLVTFLNNSVIHKDGSKAMTANLDAGSNKIVNLTAGTASTDAVNKTQMDTAIGAAISAALPTGTAVLAGTSVQLTNGAQEISIPYGDTFTGNPIVLLTNGDRSAASFTVSVNGKSTSSVTARCDGAGVGTSVRVDWIAVGTLA